MIRCLHCGKPISENYDDIEYDETIGDYRVLWYHNHSGEHLCDSGKTGAYPKNKEMDER
jgi:DNA-directed RNA polymerase subunit N (RpoN/RPB10)